MTAFNLQMTGFYEIKTNDNYEYEKFLYEEVIEASQFSNL